jgi:hypothetical protein
MKMNLIRQKGLKWIKVRTMRTLSHFECLAISGADDDIFDLGDVFTMIENRESKLLLLGTMLALGAGLYTGSVTYSTYGFAYGIVGYRRNGCRFIFATTCVRQLLCHG